MGTSPDYLYKYRTYNAHSLACLANQTIWLTKPKSFNDPFDCAITLDRALYKESITHAITVAMDRAKRGHHNRKDLLKEWPGDKDAFENFRENIKELIQNMGVCAFSATCDEILLWSHYADHHKGFCIEYDCREGTKLRELAHKVRYHDEVPKLSAGDFAGPKKSDALDALWLTKSTAWSYEKEWRVMMNVGDKEYQDPSNITSVIFGAKMPESNRLPIMNILQRNYKITFKETVLAEGQFKLEIRNYER